MSMYSRSISPRINLLERTHLTDRIGTGRNGDDALRLDMLGHAESVQQPRDGDHGVRMRADEDIAWARVGLG